MITHFNTKSIHVNDNLNAILSGLEKVKKVGAGRYQGRCIFHEDTTPSAGITQKPDGTILIHCFSCGASGLDFCNALGIDPSTLFPPTDNPKYEKRNRSGFSAWQILNALRGDLIRLLIIANDLEKINVLSGDDRDFVAEIVLRLNDGFSYLDGGTR